MRLCLQSVGRWLSPTLSISLLKKHVAFAIRVKCFFFNWFPQLTCLGESVSFVFDATRDEVSVVSASFVRWTRSKFVGSRNSARVGQCSHRDEALTATDDVHVRPIENRRETFDLQKTFFISFNHMKRI